MNNERSPHMNWTQVCLSLVFIVATCSYAELAGAKSEYEVIHTGIQGGGCWLDNNHFVIEKRVLRQGLQGTYLEGLYFVDPDRPRDLRSISLAPLESDVRKQVWSVSCQEGHSIFLTPGTKQGSSRLYRLTIAGQPDLLVEMRAPRVNLSGQYVLGNSHKAVMDGGPLQGVFEGNDDCLLSSAKPGFRALCWDWWLVMPQPLRQFVFSEYRWEETIKVKDSTGQVKWVPNTRPSLMLPDGTQIRQGYLLRDFESRIVQEVQMRQGTYQYDTSNFRTDPQGQYLYAPCWRDGDHGDKHLTVGGRVCRFRLDGRNADWEEVVSVQQSPQDPFSLHDLSVSEGGDVVMIERGHRGEVSLLKYVAQAKAVDKVLQVHSPEDLGVPQLSLNGKWMSVIRQGQLVLIDQKGVMP